MPFMNASSLRWQQHGKIIRVHSPFWSVTHDLSQGGAPTGIEFEHGLPGNLLVEPFRTEVDGLSDVRCPDARLLVARWAPEGVRLVFRGYLGPARGRVPKIRFKTSYVYTPYWMRREVQLDFPRGISAKRMSPLAATFDQRMTHWNPQEVTTPSGTVLEMGKVPEKPGVFWNTREAPVLLSLFRPGGEGIQILPAADLNPWGSPGGTAGQGRFQLARRRKGVGLRLDAPTLARPAAIPRRLVFTAFITLVNVPAVQPAPLRTVMVGNPPFPSDEILRAWSESGVELIVIMEGAAWFAAHAAGTDRFWRTGSYPCYRDRKDMRDMDRMVASSHRFGIRVIPYTCPTEVHPELPRFARNIGEWHVASRPMGHVLYNPAGKMPRGLSRPIQPQGRVGRPLREPQPASDRGGQRFRAGPARRPLAMRRDLGKGGPITGRRVPVRRMNLVNFACSVPFLTPKGLHS